MNDDQCMALIMCALRAQLEEVRHRRRRLASWRLLLMFGRMDYEDIMRRLEISLS